MTVRLRIFDAGDHFKRRLPLIRRSVTAAIDHAAEHSGLADVDVVVHPKDQGPDQWAVEAFTLGPHNVHIGVERSELSSEELETDLFRCAVHELHHAWRWGLMGRRTWSVGEAIVLEGLAMLADHAAAGPQHDVDRPLDEPCRAMREFAAIRHEPVARHRAWLHSPEPSQPGGVSRLYSVGRVVMRAAILEKGTGPWEAAALPTDDLVETGLGTLRRMAGPRQASRAT
jgi:hypothetical protein